MPRRPRRHRAVPGAFLGTVFAHGRRRDLVTRRQAVPPAEPADLMAGRITTLVDRLRLRRRR
jgi:hypothetical protein